MKGFIVLDTCIPKREGVLYYQGVVRDMVKEHFALEQAAGQSIDPAAVGTNPKNGEEELEGFASRLNVARKLLIGKICHSSVYIVVFLLVFIL